MEKDSRIFEILNELNISYQIHKHEAVHTVEEAERFWKDIPGVHTKNIFLRDEKGKNHYLIILKHTKNLNIKEMEKKIGARKLSFASEQRLSRYLGLSKGAVSPFGLVNDTENQVKVIIDESLAKAKTVNFHPNVNTATVSISSQDFKKFLDFCGNTYMFSATF
jgi:Ala-tRNA(Pro) deacylase